MLAGGVQQAAQVDYTVAIEEQPGAIDDLLAQRRSNTLVRHPSAA